MSEKRAEILVGVKNWRRVTNGRCAVVWTHCFSCEMNFLLLFLMMISLSHWNYLSCPKKKRASGGLCLHRILNGRMKRQRVINRIMYLSLFFFFVMWKPARFCFQMPQRMQTHEVIPAPNQPPPKSPDHSYGDERQPVPDDGRFDEKWEMFLA